MRFKNISKPLICTMLLVALVSGNDLRGAFAFEMLPTSLGTPQVVVTRPYAIGIAGWTTGGQLLLTLHQGGQPPIAYLSPTDGALTVLADMAREAALQAARAPSPAPANAIASANAPLLEAQWSPNGRIRAAILAPGAQAGAPIQVTRLQLFDTVTGRETIWDDAPRFVTDIAWAPNSRWLAVLGVTEVTDEGAERAQLYLLDADEGETRLAREEFFGGGMWGQQLAWSPDGMRLAVGCPTEEEGRVCILPVNQSAGFPAARPVSISSEPVVAPMEPAHRATITPYIPPVDITLQVYQLTLGGARRLPYTLCEPGSTAWGCTVFCNEVDFPCVRTMTMPYPYTTNPITIPIESDYLLDVVPLEMGTYYHATALVAQAAAARSYAYRAIYDGRVINNSTAFQAFIPYKFESLPTASFPDSPETPCASGNLNSRQRIICDAVAPGYYVAYGSTLEEFVPAFAEFSADAWLRTVNGGRVYLRGIEDPISSGCDANNYGHQRGMSQEGASRWARGNRCSYAGTGDEPWSVRWDDARQILTHYYTGIQLRNSAGAQLTPDYRWTPLEIDWRSNGVNPPLLQPGETRTITFTVQNTGIYTWTGQVSLAHHGWEDESGTPVITATTSVSIPQTVAPGESIRVGIPLTSPSQSEALRRYHMRFDMLLHEEGGPVGFSLREPERPWPIYEVKITVMILPNKMFLPLSLRAAEE